jgi:hypothetical protein
VTDEVGERSVNQQNTSCSKHLLMALAAIDQVPGKKITKKPSLLCWLFNRHEDFSGRYYARPNEHFYCCFCKSLTVQGRWGMNKISCLNWQRRKDIDNV